MYGFVLANETWKGNDSLFSTTLEQVYLFFFVRCKKSLLGSSPSCSSIINSNIFTDYIMLFFALPRKIFYEQNRFIISGTSWQDGKTNFKTWPQQWWYKAQGWICWIQVHTPLTLPLITVAPSWPWPWRLHKSSSHFLRYSTILLKIDSVSAFSNSIYKSNELFSK